MEKIEAALMHNLVVLEVHNQTELRFFSAKLFSRQKKQCSCDLFRNSDNYLTE